MNDNYKAVSCRHLNYSDHISMLLIPSYKPVQKREKRTTKSIKIWPEGESSALQDCFDCTDWNMFKEAAIHSGHTDLDEYAASVTGFISVWMMLYSLGQSLIVQTRGPQLNAKVHSSLPHDKVFNWPSHTLKTKMHTLECCSLTSAPEFNTFTQTLLEKLSTLGLSTPM